MSSDYLINKKALQEAGVIFIPGICEFTGDPMISAKLPGYEYLREVWEAENAQKIGICCSGQFRSWLDDFLNKNEISHSKY